MKTPIKNGRFVTAVDDCRADILRMQIRFVGCETFGNGGIKQFVVGS